MQNGSKTMMNTYRQKSAKPFANGSRRWTSNSTHPESRGPQNAQRNYERYLALARAETQIGNTVAAENYYQYAEHYFRSMRSDSDGA